MASTLFNVYANKQYVMYNIKALYTKSGNKAVCKRWAIVDHAHASLDNFLMFLNLTAITITMIPYDIVLLSLNMHAPLS